MPRSCWRYVVAGFGIAVLFGLFITVAVLTPSPQPNWKNGREQSKAGDPKPRGLSHVPRPIKSVEVRDGAEEKWPCTPGQDNRNSDLCAQWKAADSASDSAWWAMASTILAAVGTAGLFWTLFYTRQALKLASDSARDQDRALEIAERNAAAAIASAAAANKNVDANIAIGRAQTRAYIGINNCNIFINNEGTLGIKFEYVNTGKSPAQNAIIFYEIGIIVGDIRRNSIVDVIPIGSLWPENSIPHEKFFYNVTAAPNWQGIFDQPFILQVNFRVTYQDIFEVPRDERSAVAILNWDRELNNVWRPMTGLSVGFVDRET